MYTVMTVCTGNICRSPMAEIILRDMIRKQGLDWLTDSAGTGDYHVGEQRFVGPRHDRELTDAALAFLHSSGRLAHDSSV